MCLRPRLWVCVTTHRFSWQIAWVLVAHPPFARRPAIVTKKRKIVWIRQVTTVPRFRNFATMLFWSRLPEMNKGLGFRVLNFSSYRAYVVHDENREQYRKGFRFETGLGFRVACAIVTDISQKTTESQKPTVFMLSGLIHGFCFKGFEAYGLGFRVCLICFYEYMFTRMNMYIFLYKSLCVYIYMGYSTPLQRYRLHFLLTSLSPPRTVR